MLLRKVEKERASLSRIESIALCSVTKIYPESGISANLGARCDGGAKGPHADRD